jgi:hypothetical protein
MNADLELRLPSIERWSSETKNPVYAWEAIASCLGADPPVPIPEWCLPYLAETARNLTSLARRHDFRADKPAISPDQAHSLVPEALGISRQGQKNAFRRTFDEGQEMRAALDTSLGVTAETAIKTRLNRTLSPERQRQIIRRGKRLLGRS